MIWCTKQSITSESVVEEKYMSQSYATLEPILLRYFIKEVHLIVHDDPDLIFLDTQGWISVAKNYFLSEKSKHIDIKF